MFLNESSLDKKHDDRTSTFNKPLPNEVNSSNSSIQCSPVKANKMFDMLNEQKILAEQKRKAKKKSKVQQMVRQDVGTSLMSATTTVCLRNEHNKNDSDDEDDEMFSKVLNINSWDEETSSSITHMHVAPIYDPNVDHSDQDSDTEHNQIIGIDLTDLARFVSTPVPQDKEIQCYIVRNKGGLKKKMYPQYEMYLKDGDKFVLAAKKRSRNKTSNYIVSKTVYDINKDSPHFMGKLRSNVWGTEFVMYDNGASPPSANSQADDDLQTTAIRNELGAVFYESNILGSRGPRKMHVVLPNVLENGEMTQWKPLKDDDSVAVSYKRGETSGMNCLENRAPKWNEQVGAYVLNFNGRVTMASVKNFQLIEADQPDKVIMQFGRVERNRFNIDFRWPLTPMQALMIALSSFDYKVACE